MNRDDACDRQPYEQAVSDRPHACLGVEWEPALDDPGIGNQCCDAASNGGSLNFLAEPALEKCRGAREDEERKSNRCEQQKKYPGSIVHADRKKDDRNEKQDSVQDYLFSWSKPSGCCVHVGIAGKKCQLEKHERRDPCRGGAAE